MEAESAGTTMSRHGMDEVVVVGAIVVVLYGVYRGFYSRGISSGSHAIVSGTKKKIPHRYQAIIWDFDQTILGGMHTTGHANAAKIKLAATKVTEGFRRLVNRVVRDAPDIQLGVATFSDPAMARDNELGGEEMVRAVLTKALGKDISDLFYVAGAYPPMHDGMPAGKHWHLYHILEEIEAKTGQVIPQSHAVLFDDDKNNVAIAIEDGFPAVVVNKRTGFQWSDWEQCQETFGAQT